MAGRCHSLLPRRDGFFGGGRSWSGDIAQSRDREVEEGTVLRAAGQWNHLTGARAGWLGFRTGNHEHGLDAAAASFFDVSWEGYLFAGSRPPGRRVGLLTSRTCGS